MSQLEVKVTARGRGAFTADLMVSLHGWDKHEHATEEQEKKRCESFPFLKKSKFRFEKVSFEERHKKLLDEISKKVF